MKIEEFIKKWLYVNYDENFDKIAQDLQSLTGTFTADEMDAFYEDCEHKLDIND